MKRREYTFGDHLHVDTKLTFLYETEPYMSKAGNKKRQGAFICECGSVIQSAFNHVNDGKTISCGCYGKDKRFAAITKHGYSNTKINRAWFNMVRRCSDTDMVNYGGRGISVCERWLGDTGFSNFLEDMGEPKEEETLDRINVNGGYCKENCRWADLSMQGYNKRRRKLNKSGRTGVYFDRDTKSWRAQITKNRIRMESKRFKDYADAVEFREILEIKYYGELLEESI